MFQGAAGDKTHETITEQSADKDDGIDGEAFLIFFKLFKHDNVSCLCIRYKFPSSIIRHVFDFFFAAVNMSAGTVDSTVAEHDMVECQSPEGKAKADAAAVSEVSSAVSRQQDVPKESTTTSSPDTDSPVMISVDVSSM